MTGGQAARYPMRLRPAPAPHVLQIRGTTRQPGERGAGRGAAPYRRAPNSAGARAAACEEGVWSGSRVFCLTQASSVPNYNDLNLWGFLPAWPGAGAGNVVSCRICDAAMATAVRYGVSGSAQSVGGSERRAAGAEGAAAGRRRACGNARARGMLRGIHVFGGAGGWVAAGVGRHTTQRREWVETARPRRRDPRRAVRKALRGEGRQRTGPRAAGRFARASMSRASRGNNHSPRVRSIETRRARAREREAGRAPAAALALVPSGLAPSEDQPNLNSTP